MSTPPGSHQLPNTHRGTMRVSSYRQFTAIMYKNFILQIRSRKAIFGFRVGGLASLAFEILVPVLFISAMCLVTLFPKFAYPPLIFKQYDLQSSQWSHPYTGSSKSAQLIIAPDVPRVRHVANLIMKGLVCGRQAQPHFAMEFRQLWRHGIPEQCLNDEVYCMEDASCTANALTNQTHWLPDSKSVANAIEASPGAYDAALLFDVESDMKYTIRMNHTQLPHMHDLLSDMSIGKLKLSLEPDSDWKKYFFFSNLQSTVDRSLMALHLQGENATTPLDVRVKVKAFPWPAEDEALGSVVAGVMFVYLLVLAFQQPTRNIVNVIVKEKEIRLREYMQVLGLHGSVYWGSWLVTHMSLLCISGTLCSLIGKIPFQNSSIYIMLLFFYSVSFSLVSFSYFIASFLSNSRIASLVTPLIYFVSMAPGFTAIFTESQGGLTWYIACLLPPSAMTMYAFTLTTWESIQQGINWHTVTISVTDDIYFSSASIIGMLILDGVLFWCLMLVVNRFSREGSFLTAVDHYIRGIRETKRVESTAARPTFHADRVDTNDVAISIKKLSRSFATVTTPKLAVIDLDLKIYNNQVTALLGQNGAGKSTTISMLTGMLPPTSGRALIAGLDMATHMPEIRHSLGVCPQFDILWPSLTVREHLELFASLRGVPSCDVTRVAHEAAEEVDLVEKMAMSSEELSGGQKRKLSVAIAFLGDPKIVFLDEPTSGMDPQARRYTWNIIRKAKEGRAIVLTTHSMEEADVLCDRIAILTRGRLAAVGTSLSLKAKYGVGYKLTIVRQNKSPLHVHEPTVADSFQNGLTQSQAVSESRWRRTCDSAAMWSHENECDHSLSVARHFDIGNYTHVSAATCSGPVGESLEIEQSSGSGRAASSVTDIGSLHGVTLQLAAQDLEIQQLVQQYVADAIPLTHAGDELSFQLPRSDLHAFPALLRDIERSKSELGMRSYGLSVTTLEEVFLRIAADSDEDAAQALLAEGTPLLSPSASSSTKFLTNHADQKLPVIGETIHENGRAKAHYSGCSLWFRQFRACFIKHAICQSREGWATLNQMSVPLAMVLCAVWLSNHSSAVPDEPVLVIGRGAIHHHPGLLSASQEVQQQPHFMDLREELVHNKHFSYTNITELDPALYPFGLPQNGTVDSVLSNEWYQSTSTFDVLHFENIPPLNTSPSVSQGADGNTSLSQQEGSSPDNSFLAYTIMVNETAKHGVPVAINTANNALLDVMLEQQQRKERNLLHLDVHPYPMLPSELQARLSKENAQANLATLTTVGLGVLTASFVVTPVKERASGSIHVMLVSGLKPSAMWMSLLVWDMMVYLVSVSSLLACLVGFAVDGMTGSHVLVLVAFFILAGLAALPQTYLLHYLYTDEMRAFSAISAITSFLGIFGFFVTTTLDLLVKFSQGKYTAAYSTADNITTGALNVLSPHFLSMKILSALSTVKAGQNPWAWSISGESLSWLGFQAVLNNVIVLIVVTGCLKPLVHLLTKCFQEGLAGIGLQSTPAIMRTPLSSDTDNTSTYVPSDSDAVLVDVASRQPDEDVVAHALTVSNSRPSDFMLIMNKVRKYYGGGISMTTQVKAVDDVSLGVEAGQCFGLLGTNGAGKTTLFRMLTEEVWPTSGQITIAGHDLAADPESARRSTGYCPQLGGLIHTLTARESLWLYARVRGLREACIPQAVTNTLARLGLSENADLPSGKLSGGNQRKLSVAIAMIGDPPVLLLDEPSTGMDPAARRSLWAAIQKAQHAGHTIILTSHIMEECDALCTQIGILVQGVLRCLGSPQHLKTKFGGGYVLEARLPEEQHSTLVSRTRAAFPPAVLVATSDEGSDVISISLEQEGLDVPTLFEFAEKEQESLGIVTYAVSQSTLEHVFVRIANSSTTVSRSTNLEALPRTPSPESSIDTASLLTRL